MPLNTLRLNHQKSSHPNDRITFIKPLPRPPSDQSSYDIADTFLRAIAAQCLPLMKQHYLSVTTLEEYEPNPEFIGRNFNNGEIIQLVLRTKDGRWVPFNAVQMVMMHELAHNTHMNHGRDFWKTRNVYAGEMKALWAKKYTGEGFWSSGRTLRDMGTAIGNITLRSGELEGLPLCGGTYRSRNRRRRRRQDKPDLSWREKRDRRIEKKFGKNGVALGEDEDKRLALEVNRKGPIGRKPRVAQSARGRELRAAAALARFESNKKEVDDLRKAEEGQTESGDDQDDDYEDLDAGLEDARDVNGRKILDSRGHGMIRIGDQDAEDDSVRHELHEINTLDRYFNSFRLGQESTGVRPGRAASADKSATPPPKTVRALESDTSVNSQSPLANSRKHQPRASTPSAAGGHSLLTRSEKSPGASAPSACDSRQTRNPGPVSQTSTFPSTIPTKQQGQTPRPAPPVAFHSTVPAPRSSTRPCPICSLENPSLNATCVACAHVIDVRKDPRHWACQSDACRSSGSAYLNAGDARICGICGARRTS
jgi:DNA-dependent metalloprotease WSS1